MKMDLLKIMIVADSPHLRHSLFDILKNHFVSGISPVKVFINRYKHLANVYPDLEFMIIDATKATNSKNLIAINDTLFNIFMHLKAIILLSNTPKKISSSISDDRISVLSPKKIDGSLVQVIKSHL
jgi:hypothetical protein